MNKNSYRSCAPGFRSCVCVVVVISGPLLMVNTNGRPYQICAWRRRRRRRRKLKSLFKAKQFLLAKFRKLGNLLGWETPKFVQKLQWNWLQEFQQQKIMLWVFSRQNNWEGGGDSWASSIHNLLISLSKILLRGDEERYTTKHNMHGMCFAKLPNKNSFLQTCWLSSVSFSLDLISTTIFTNKS